MNNYNVYRNIKAELVKKKIKLSDLKKKSTEIKYQIDLLETEIEEDLNGLNMVFDCIITQKSIS